MNHYEPGISYPRRRDDWMRDHPLAGRLLVMLVGFAVLVPIGLVVRASQGNVVRSGGLPGAALAADPLIAPSSTSTTTGVAPSTAAPAVSSGASGPAAPPSTEAVAKAPTAAVAAAEVSPSTTVKKAATTTTGAPATTAAKKAAATTAAPKATTPPTTHPPTTKAAPATAATTQAPTTTTTETQDAPPPNTYSKDQVEAIIRSVFPAQEADEAVRVASRESNLVPTVRNWCCYGLFQIYFKTNQKTLATIGVTTAAQLYDPTVNAQAAYLLFQRSGWAPWR
jgi:hypothetical protein